MTRRRITQQPLRIPYDWYINGKYFHSDRDYRAKLTEMEKYPLDRDLFRSHFLNFVIEASRHALYLDGLIRYAQREGKIELTHADDPSATRQKATDNDAHSLQ